MILFRTLARAKKSDVGDAAAEIIVIAILCLLPLVGIAFNSYLHQPVPVTLPNHESTWLPFSTFAANNITRGQLAFYAISNWATALWLCGREYKNLFPWRIVIIVMGVVGFYYCGILIDPSHVPEQAEASVFGTSTGLYLASMACYFVVALYAKIPAPSAEDTNLAEAESLRKKLKSRRGTR